MVQVPLYVLLFESVKKGVLDFDYAPASMLVSNGGKSKRTLMNISQEGKSAVDDLLEFQHLNIVKVRGGSGLCQYIHILAVCM